MLECPNCYKSVESNSKSCNYCGYHIPANTKAIPVYKETKNKFFKLPDDTSIVSIKEWLFLFLLLCVPILNLFVIYHFGFKDKQNSSIRNFLRAVLILLIIPYGFYILEFGLDLIKSLF